MNFRSKKTVMLWLLGLSVLLFGGGMIAFFVERNNTICPNGKPPVAQRSEVIGSTEYKCSDGVVVTK